MNLITAIALLLLIVDFWPISIEGQKTFNDLLRQSQQELNGNLVIRYPHHHHHLEGTTSTSTTARKQKTYGHQMAFMCANRTRYGVGRSTVRPSSVHRLRPGDIDVIGAMGDSLIAGNGAMEEWALGTMIEYRGVSWCAGGQGTWRQYLTLPNILKEFNANLTGYSTGTGEFLSHHSQLNVAYPVSADSDSLRQAKILVKKMKSDRRIDVANDWKMITIFFGANDLCSAQCFDREQASPRQHARKLMAAIDYLYAHLPRTFINLIPVIDATVSVRVKRSMMCHLLHRLFCMCFHRQHPNDKVDGAASSGSSKIDVAMDVIMRLARDYQTVEELLVSSGRYDRRDDFTVVFQPFMKLFNAPFDPLRRYDEVIDISYITHDCFHFSQKGHALASNLLWNNLLEPVGQKSTKNMRYVLERFKCPSEAAPFFFTYKNTQSYLKYGHQ